MRNHDAGNRQSGSQNASNHPCAGAYLRGLVLHVCLSGIQIHREKYARRQGKEESYGDSGQFCFS